MPHTEFSNAFRAGLLSILVFVGGEFASASAGRLFVHDEACARSGPAQLHAAHQPLFVRHDASVHRPDLLTFSPIALESASPSTSGGRREVSQGGNVPRVTLHKIAEVGDPAPSPAGQEGFVFEGFGAYDNPINPFVTTGRLVHPPTMDQDGNVGFFAFRGTDGILDEFDGSVLPSGVYQVFDGNIELVVSAGDPIPDTQGSEFGIILQSGNLWQRVTVLGDGVFWGANGFDPPDCDLASCLFSGIWSNAFGPVDTVLKTGDPIPGAPPNHVHSAATTGIAADQFLFNILTKDPQSSVISNDNEGFWRDRSGSLELITFNGVTAPGIVPPQTFTNTVLNAGPFGIWTHNRAGRLLFHGWFTGPQLDNEGFWAEGPDGLFLVVREGQPCPPLPDFGDGFSFNSTSGLHSFGDLQIDPTISISNNGEYILFGASIINPEVTYFHTGVGETINPFQSIWVWHDGAFEYKVKGVLNSLGPDLLLGDPVPGFPPPNNFSQFGFGAVNNNGHIVLAGAFKEGPGDVVNPDVSVELFWDVPGELTLFTRAGDPVPVAELQGSVFDQVTVGFFEDTDAIWYTATFSGPGVDLTNNQAVFRINPEGEHEILLRLGDLVEVDRDGEPPELKTIESFAIGQLNDAGQGVMEVFFVDGTNGIYVAQLVQDAPVPVVGDIDGDGDVDQDDADALVAVLIGLPMDPAHVAPSDLNGDGSPNGLDIQPFVAALLSP